MSLKPEFLKVIRFLAVGAFNTLAGYLLFAAFYLGAKFSANLSNALSYLIMISIAFVLYERFVFGAGQKGRLRSGLLYLLSAGFAFLCNLAVLNGLLTAGMSPLIAQIGAMATYSIVFYLCNRLIVFR